jgi:DNA-binding protein HU-beta
LEACKSGKSLGKLKKNVHFYLDCDTITIAKRHKAQLVFRRNLVMNKSELISEVASKTALPKKDAEKAVNAFIDTVKEAIAKKDKVQLIGFGTFEARVREARTGKNPRTHEPIKIPKATVPAFKAGKAFKDAVNK